MDLKRGVINVPASNLAGRELKLEASQMLLLLEYTQDKKPFAKLFPRLSVGKAGNQYNQLKGQLKRHLHQQSRLSLETFLNCGALEYGCG